MTSRLICVLAVLVFLGAQVAAPAAQGPVTLALKFAVGDTMQYDISFSGGGGMTAPGAELTPLGAQGILSLSQRVVEVLPDGSGRLEVRLPKADLQVSIKDEKVGFSWADGKLRWFAGGQESSPPSDVDLSKIPLLSTAMIITIAANGIVRDVAFSDPKLMAEIAKQVPGFGLGQLQAGQAPVFPDKPVAVGEMWRNTFQLLPFGPSQPVNVSVSRTLDSYEEQAGVGVAKISSFTDTRFRGGAPFNIPGQQLSFSMPEARETVTSTEFFDTTRGRLLRGDYDIAFSTQFSVTAAEAERSGGVEARLRVSVQAR